MNLVEVGPPAELVSAADLAAVTGALAGMPPGQQASFENVFRRIYQMGTTGSKRFCALRQSSHRSESGTLKMD